MSNAHCQCNKWAERRRVGKLDLHCSCLTSPSFLCSWGYCSAKTLGSRGRLSIPQSQERQWIPNQTNRKSEPGLLFSLNVTATHRTIPLKQPCYRHQANNLIKLELGKEEHPSDMSCPVKSHISSLGKQYSSGVQALPGCQVWTASVISHVSLRIIDHIFFTLNFNQAGREILFSHASTRMKISDLSSSLTSCRYCIYAFTLTHHKQERHCRVSLAHNPFQRLLPNNNH